MARARARTRTTVSPDVAARAVADIGLYAELHLHLGGAILPNILFAHMQRDGHALMKRYPTYERFERFFTRRRSGLADYLKMHALVERLQRPADQHMFYFVTRLVRGAFLFDNLAYMELRHTPYNRTDAGLDMRGRIGQMRSVVQAISAAASAQPQYPLVLRQILCMHSALPREVNEAICELAIEMSGEHEPMAGYNGGVVALDLAGPNEPYAERIDEFVTLFRRAKSRSGGRLKTTAHVFETRAGCFPKLLPYLDRIGHGIQIPLRYPKLLSRLARDGQCLEVCPTTYLRTGTLRDYTELRPVFAKCRAEGVPIAICTDNGGLHNVRLPGEYENLLVRDVIGMEELGECLRASFQHAFAWKGPPPDPLRRVTIPR